MKYLYSTVAFLLLTSLCSAQTYTIKGSVFDTLNKSSLPQATITLIRASDSVIETFARTRNDGGFELHPRNEGKYILMATFPSFVDYVDDINIKNKKTVDLGMIPMVSKDHLLHEFVLTQQYAAIKIKGDTTEYMADSFKVKEGATVEDLLKRLPGIQVDKNGQVTAQGETVQKILVDGEEFFSDDPAVVTKNLQSNVVEKVQVYDKKSDQAEFTGIDDGQKTKTINLQLKEDKKNGYFGKIDAGGGTDGYFQDQGMINDFKGKQQISVFGIMSNTDKVGLGWTDNDKFGSGNGTTQITDDGQISTTFTSTSEDFSDWDGKYNGEGQPTVWTGGAHYANKWDDGAEHVTGNYRYAQQNVDIDGNTTTQYVLPGNSGYLTQQHKDQFSQSMRHGADGMFEWKLDSTSSLKLTVDGGYKDTKTSSSYNTLTEFETPLQPNTYTAADTNNRKVTSNTTSQFINADLLYRKKFGKKGRTLSIDLKENYKSSTSDGYLYSNTAYNALLALPDSIIDQHKINNSNTMAVEGKITYTEPLSKEIYLEGSYGLSVNNSNAQYQSFDRPVGESQYTDFDSVYSSNYKYTILTNTGGLNLKFVYKKINFSLGSDVSDASYQQKDLMYDSTYNRNYFNIFPKASFTYKFDKQTTFNFNYYGSTRQPTIDQLQPLHQNTDPQNIQVGNPNLQQQFQNTIVMRYSDFKVLTGRYLWASLSGNFINNAISTSQHVDSTGTSTTQYVNVNGNYNGWGYVGYGMRLSKLDMNVGGHLQTSLNHIISYVNGVKDVSDNSTYTFGLDFSYYKDKKYEIQFTPGITYNDNQSSISTFTTSYWSSDNNLNGSVQLPLKFEVGTNIDWFIRQQTTVFPTNNDVFRWNMYVSKKFLKKSQLELRAYVYDILNQNIGYSRYVQGTAISQDTYNTIHRYGMLSLVWNFTKTSGGAPPPSEGGMMMMR